MLVLFAGPGRIDESGCLEVDEQRSSHAASSALPVIAAKHLPWFRERLQQLGLACPIHDMEIDCERDFTQGRKFRQFVNRHSPNRCDWPQGCASLGNRAHRHSESVCSFGTILKETRIRSQCYA